jgi:type I restriction enzyme, R subunit
MPDPEELAREQIDALLKPCGWDVQDKRNVNLSASRGVAVRELTFKTGEPDYTLFVDGKAIGTIEAKPAGHSLTGVEEQSEKYVSDEHNTGVVVVKFAATAADRSMSGERRRSVV